MKKVYKWYYDQLRKDTSTVEEIPLSKLDKWYFDDKTGNISHVSGKFFSVQGVKISTNCQNCKKWEQPIINQPEIGVLGILTKKIKNQRYLLLQTKMEPGNINKLQLSPTVQATMSNYTQVHNGKKTDYLDCFLNAPAAKILVDSLQAEQGGRFYQKRNRNIIVDLDDEVELKENYYWVKESDLKPLLQEDNLVNMNTRSVLSCYLTCFNLNHKYSMNKTIDIMNWVTNLKVKYNSEVKIIPLKNIKNWVQDDTGVRNVSNKYFSVIAVKVKSNNREVREWTQPIIKETQVGIVGFIMKKINGIDHYLVQAKIEPGNIDNIYLAPTIQNSYCNIDKNFLYMPYFLEAKPGQIRYNAILSEEGGRFYHYQNRYIVVEIDEDIELLYNYRWISISQLLEFIRYGLLNVEARTAIAGININNEDAGFYNGCSG